MFFASPAHTWHMVHFHFPEPNSPTNRCLFWFFQHWIRTKKHIKQKQHYVSPQLSLVWTIWRHNGLSAARPGAKGDADVSHASSRERVTGRIRWRPASTAGLVVCLSVNERICVGHFLHPAWAQSAHQTRATDSTPRSQECGPTTHWDTHTQRKTTT